MRSDRRRAGAAAQGLTPLPGLTPPKRLSTLRGLTPLQGPTALRGLAMLVLLVLAPAARAIPLPCARLLDAKLPDTRIVQAQDVAPDPLWKYPPSLFTQFNRSGSQGVQQPFCRVVAVIGKEIHVELWLPVKWNGKFEGVGNGGFTGAINYPAMGSALAQGYATASTDTGHVTEHGFFEDDWIAGHPQRVVDFAYRAHHLMAQMGKKLTAAYYGRSIDRSYYSGCSSGGWQGLSEAQRYPDDYDGIVAGAPAINVVQLQSRGILLAQMALRDPAGNLGREERQLLVEAAVRKCDARDGVADGVIDDPRHCDFDPAELVCAPGQSQHCLTPAQVTRARSLYGPATTAGGLQLYPGAAPGSEPLVFLPAAGVEPGHTQMALMLQHKPDWSVADFDPDRHIPVLEHELGALLDTTNPDLSRFRAHGGKLILYHGWADPLLSPYNTIDYYESVVQAMGEQQAEGFLRLFMLPGMEHCGGGAGPGEFDAVAALSQWVEHGVEPRQIVAAHRSDGRIDRTRPLCPYPQLARYKGQGSRDEAASFVCEAQPLSVTH